MSSKNCKADVAQHGRAKRLKRQTVRDFRFSGVFTQLKQSPVKES